MIQTSNISYEQLIKERTRLLILLLVETADLLACFLVFYLWALPMWAYIVFVLVLPFGLTMFEFYPFIDLFNKKVMFTKKEGLLAAFSVLVLAAYITGMFLLHA